MQPGVSSFSAAAPASVPVDTVTTRVAQLVAVASGLGAPDLRCAEGPLRLLDSGLADRLGERGIRADVGAVLRAGKTPSWRMYRVLAALCSRLAGEVKAALGSGATPVVLGGDHSCAIGTWSGVARAMASRGSIGLVWIDAHMDSHTPATSHSGRPHGMPLAALLGFGSRRLLPNHLATLVTDPPVCPAFACLVGIRSYEREEAWLLERLGVRVFGMAEIAARGVAAVMDEAIERAARADAGYGISIDLDAVDPADAPGVGSPVAGGIAAQPLLESLRSHGDDSRLLGLEIAEYNPYRDAAGRTATLVEELLCAALGKPATTRAQFLVKLHGAADCSVSTGGSHAT